MKARKATAILLTACLLAFTAACGKGGDNTISKAGVDSKASVAPTAAASSKLGETHAYQKSDLLPLTLYINLTGIQFDIGMPKYGKASVGTGHYSMGTGRKYYYIVDQYVNDTSDTHYKVKLENIKKPSDVLTEMKAQFISMGGSELPSYGKLDCTFTKTEDVTVNGWGMCKFEGYFTIEKSLLNLSKAQFFGYSVLKGGYPVYFIGVDNTPEQSNGAMLQQYVDAMSKTFREYNES